MASSATDSYGEWVIRKLQQEAGGNAHPFPAEVLAAARMVWPRIPVLVAAEIKPEGSLREAEALAAEIWEEVLRSVGRAIGRNGNYASSIRDPEAYLLVAFQHRFRRFQESGTWTPRSVSGSLNESRSRLGRRCSRRDLDPET